MSILHQFVKHAGDLPLWIRAPGVPFNIPIPGEREERLQGMHDWVPISTIARIQEKLDRGTPREQILQEERALADPKGALVTSAMGGFSGGLLSRLIHGEKATEPMKEILKSGITRESLSGLKGVPASMRALPIAGAGLGALVSVMKQRSEADSRERAARGAIRGLAIEDLHTQNALLDAVQAAKGLQKASAVRFPLAELQAHIKEKAQAAASGDNMALLPVTLAAGVGGVGGYALGKRVAQYLPVGGAAAGALLLAAVMAAMQGVKGVVEYAAVKSAASSSFSAKKYGPAQDVGQQTAAAKVTAPGPGADGSQSVFNTPPNGGAPSVAAVAKIKTPGAVMGGSRTSGIGGVGGMKGKASVGSVASVSNG